MSDINILLFLSDYKEVFSEGNQRGARELEYQLMESERVFKGIQTNDAPVRYMFEQAKENQGCIKRVLCITSYEVYTKPSDISQLERFKVFVNQLATEFGMPQPLEYISIPYDYEESSGNKKDYGSELPTKIYNKLANCFQQVNEGEQVFIDYTGGLRDISFLMTSIIRFLEFKGLVCGEIVYSNYFNKKMYDIHYIYDLYQLINGVNEFINTGNARELEKAYGESIEYSPASKLVRRLIDFSDALSICDIGNLDEKVEGLLAALDEVEKCESQEINTAMLKTLAPIIREKMYLEEGFNYPRIIQWCAENNLIQQAATIYTDKMPIYYFDRGLVPGYVNLAEIEPSPGHSLYDTGFYTELFDRAAEGIEVALFRESLKNIVLEFNGNMNRADIIAAINNEQVNMEGVINDAYNKLKDFINSCYEFEDLSAISMPSYTVYSVNKYEPENVNADEDGYVVTEGKIPNNLKDLWNQLISTSNYWLHFFLYNDEAGYLAISTAKKRKTDKTLRKKAFAIQQIKEGKVELGEGFDSERTYKIMAYYLAVKIMRNRMNHAGENIRTNDEIVAINALNGLGIEFEDNVKVYRKILLKGISI